jgi:hypothetical protein
LDNGKGGGAASRIRRGRGRSPARREKRRRAEAQGRRRGDRHGRRRRERRSCAGCGARRYRDGDRDRRCHGEHKCHPPEGASSPMQRDSGR